MRCLPIDWKYYRHSQADVSRLPLAQMSWCFDGEAVRSAVALQMPQLAAAPQCRIVDVYHRPGKALDVCYAFGDSIQDLSAVTLRFSPLHRGTHALGKALKQAGDPRRIFRIDEAAFAWIFPEDHELPSLDRFVARKGVMLGARILSYRRGSRCVIKLDGQAPAVAKINPDAEAQHQRLTELHRHPARQFALAEPLVFDAELSLRTERCLNGSSFADHAAEVGPAQAAKQLIGALAALHSLKMDSLPSLTPADVLARFEAMFLRRLALANLPVEDICKELGQRLASSVPDGIALPVTLHGDMHIGNVLFAEGEALLIDLDEMVSGDPAYDLAMFGSELLLVSALQPALSKNHCELVCALPGLYEAAAGRSIDPHSYAWHLAALLASRQIKSCIVHAAPDIDEVTQKLARCANEIAKAQRVSPSVLDAIYA
jgi:Phosphotransferase enzyme family